MEQQLFQLEITSPEQTQIIMVEWIEIESPTGSFFVGPDHQPLVSVIQNKGSITYKKANEEPTVLSVLQGVFKVTDNKAIALIDH